MNAPNLQHSQGTAHAGVAQNPPSEDQHPQWVQDTLIDIADIRRIFKLGRTAAYELTHRPEFPDPVPVSPRCYRWWSSEVAAFAVALRQDCMRTSARSSGSRPALPGLAPAPGRITGRVRAARKSKKSP